MAKSIFGLKAPTHQRRAANNRIRTAKASLSGGNAMPRKNAVSIFKANAKAQLSEATQAAKQLKKMKKWSYLKK